MQKINKSLKKIAAFTKVMKNRINNHKFFSQYYFFSFLLLLDIFLAMEYINLVVNFMGGNATMPCIKYLQQKLSFLFFK